MEKVAKHRMREIKMWSKLKKEFNDGSFNDKDVNRSPVRILWIAVS